MAAAMAALVVRWRQGLVLGPEAWSRVIGKVKWFFLTKSGNREQTTR